ncbi:GTP 3',8-cyclase MoaA [Bacteroidota bacterium]
MLDSCNRNINYLRISVTDRCNLQCAYCMPEQGICKADPGELLSFEEIAGIARVGVDFGITKLRITGGEPLVRHDLPRLVAMLASIPGVSDLSMTTNAVLMEEFAEDLKKAGLQRVNISLDTLDPVRFRNLTRGGDLEKVLRGIDISRQVGLSPIKLNTVLTGCTTERDIQELREYASGNGFELRFIREMDREKGLFWPVEGGDGGHCGLCNRLRLSAEGFIYPCLFNDLKYSVRELGPKEAFRLAIGNKPQSGKGSVLKKMYSIGG